MVVGHLQRSFPLSPIYLLTTLFTVAGLFLCLLVLQTIPNNVIKSANIQEQKLNASAFFRDEKLIVLINNSETEEFEVLTIYLSGQNYMDYEMFTDEVIKPGENKEIETNIMPPTQRGTYAVKINLSNGLTIRCNVEIP